MLKETENEETRLFYYVFIIGGISIGGAPWAPPVMATTMLFIILRFCVIFCLFACQSDTNGSILYGHAKYVIFLVKIKIVLNSSSNFKL